MATDVVAEGSGIAVGQSYVSGTAAGSLEQTAELNELIRRAGWLGQDDSGHATASFTSLFLAFLTSSDALSLWVQDKIPYLGPARRDVLRQWKAQGSWRKQGDLDEQRIEHARTALLGAVVVRPRMEGR